MSKAKKTQQQVLQEECEELLRTLMAKHGCLQPACKDFDIWDRLDAADIVADLIALIKKSDAIDTAHHTNDWGK